MTKNKQPASESCRETKEQRHHLDGKAEKPRHPVHLIEHKFQNIIQAAGTIQLGFAMHEHQFLDQQGNSVFEIGMHCLEMDRRGHDDEKN
jgi:hypothetical protein